MAGENVLHGQIIILKILILSSPFFDAIYSWHFSYNNVIMCNDNNNAMIYMTCLAQYIVVLSVSSRVPPSCPGLKLPSHAKEFTGSDAKCNPVWFYLNLRQPHCLLFTLLELHWYDSLQVLGVIILIWKKWNYLYKAFLKYILKKNLQVWGQKRGSVPDLRSRLLIAA